MQEQYYIDLGMPICLQELDVKEDDIEEMAIRCSQNKTRVLDGYKKLGYEDMLAIYNMAYRT